MLTPTPKSKKPASLLPLISGALLTCAALVAGCGAGQVTPLTATRHQVAKACGADIADSLGSFQPFIIQDHHGQPIATAGLTIETSPYSPSSSPQPKLLRSRHCIAVARSYQGWLTVYGPLASGYRGAQLAVGRGPSPVAATALPLLPLRASLADFRRCGPSNLPPKAQTTPKALEIRLSASLRSPARSPARLSYFHVASGQSGQSGQPIQLNPRGCWYYLPHQRLGRIFVYDQGERVGERVGERALITTRPIEITRKGGMPLTICPRSAAGQLQLALPGEPCQNGFVSYCQLTLGGTLRRSLGSWIHYLAREYRTEDCHDLAKRLSAMTHATVMSDPAVPADMEALRYGMTGLDSLIIEAKKGLSYLPPVAGLKELDVYHDEPDLEAYAFREHQPKLVALSLVGGAVDVRRLPLRQLIRLTINGAKLTSLTDITVAQQLSYLNLAQNAITDLAPLTQLPKLGTLIVAENPLVDLSPLKRMPTDLRALDVSAIAWLDIELLATMSHLMDLAVARNGLTSIDWLKGFSSLERLNIAENLITDIAVLRHLPLLSEFKAPYNGISRIEPLRSAERLQQLHLDFNRIHDITPLADLALVVLFSMDGNPLGQSQKKTTGNCPVDAQSKVIRRFCTR